MGKWFGNLKIGVKFIIGFGLAIALSVTIAVVGITTASTMDANYSYILEFPNARLENLLQARLSVASVRRLTVSFVAYAGDTAALNNSKSEFDDHVATAKHFFNEVSRSMEADPRMDQAYTRAYIADVNKIIGFLDSYVSTVSYPMYNDALAGDAYKATQLMASGVSIMGELIELMETKYGDLRTYSDTMSDAESQNAERSTLILIIISVAAALVSVVVAVITAKSITKPVGQLVNIAHDVAAGNLNINSVPETKDEIGILVTNFFTVINVMKSLVVDLEEMSDKHNAGDIDFRVDESKYQGSYRELSGGINQMITAYVSESIMFANKVKDLSSGDFKIQMNKLPGKKAVLNEVLEAVRSGILGVSGEISGIIKSVGEGRTSTRIDTRKYTGDWVELMAGLNNVLENYSVPLNEMMDVLDKLSKGNFHEKMVGSYKGEFNDIKNAVNGMVNDVSSYIKEISLVLNKLADNDLDQSITRDYHGDFIEIKNAINNIIEKFNGVISEITNATDQVTTGARQISESSMTLAQGATEQASAIEELNATAISVNEKTQLNAENSNRAAMLSDELKNFAIEGNNQMKDMLGSMKAINDASANISKIISIIKDISFQTNLLALNASIEAAHAGVHGAGFSVVADEVRSLAVKSQEAANNTTELIEASIHRVKEGTGIAEKTDEALEKIVNAVSEVSNIIVNISEASNDQAIAISQINDGVSQIAQVVQSNSATSEESASAAEELSSQSEMLRNMVKVFNLK
ncbi:MAG: methyl-accepting chemotaxis protein [Defluviitaleaceae bacterium]|nr:methyl-accepting chemotaxis protein [Defluviitaleaceae bacterium]MCL2836418.1 methyl-accepting chemotaxis protein [Defluviitaleaceae bacterium]